MSRCVSRVAALGAVVLPALAMSASGCSLITGNDEYLAQVDSVHVAAPAVAGAATPVTFFGYAGFNGCADLQRVERRAAGDTIIWRFVAKGGGGNCIAIPSPLRYTDSVPSQPARTLHIRVDQRGAPVRRSVQLPIGTAP